MPQFLSKCELLQLFKSNSFSSDPTQYNPWYPIKLLTLLQDSNETWLCSETQLKLLTVLQDSNETLDCALRFNWNSWLCCGTQWNSWLCCRTQLKLLNVLGIKCEGPVCLEIVYLFVKKWQKLACVLCFEYPFFEVQEATDWEFKLNKSHISWGKKGCIFSS